MKNVLFILPVPHFFSQCGGIGGHITHADGILQALIEKCCQVDVVVGEKHAILDKEELTLHVVEWGGASLWRRILWNENLLKRIAVLSNVRSFDFCYCRYSVGFAPWIGRLKKVLGETKLVLEVNSFGSQRKRLLSVFERNAFVRADRLICVSDLIKQDLCDIFNGRIERKTVVVPNGINIHRFRECFRLRFEREQPVRIGYVGVLKSAYGLEGLIDAVRIVTESHPRVSLHIVGDGPFRESLERLAAGMPNVIVHGACTFDEVPGVLSGMDILVYPTTKENSFQSPIKIFEYMAVGRPIVAADTPQTKLILGEKGAALFFPPEDIPCLAEKIIRFIEHPEIAMSYAGNAYAMVSKKHSWGARLDMILNSVCEKID